MLTHLQRNRTTTTSCRHHHHWHHSWHGHSRPYLLCCLQYHHCSSSAGKLMRLIFSSNLLADPLTHFHCLLLLRHFQCYRYRYRYRHHRHRHGLFFSFFPRLVSAHRTTWTSPLSSMQSLPLNFFVRLLLFEFFVAPAFVWH